MTLTTYRSPAARLLHAALDLAARCRRALRAYSGPASSVRAFTVLEVAALRDMGLVPPDFESFGAVAGATSASPVTPEAIMPA